MSVIFMVVGILTDQINDYGEYFEEIYGIFEDEALADNTCEELIKNVRRSPNEEFVVRAVPFNEPMPIFFITMSD